MIVYLDTSALVKLYVRESGTSEMRVLSRDADAIASATVAYAECRAAFARALREGTTGLKQHRTRVASFNKDWERVLRVELLSHIVRHAGDVAELYGLRGFDAIHLASALWLRDKVGADDFGFGVFDRRLLAAAEQAGLKIVTGPALAAE